MHFSRRYLSALLFAAALAFGAAWQSAPAVAQVTPQNVVIEGSTHTDAATIRSYFTGTDQASVNRAVADLSATGMFSKVSAKIVDGQVIVTVVESAQIINRVAFEGNRTLKSDQLAVEVQEKGHTGFDAAKADADVERIKDAYKKIGHAEVQVSYRLVQLPNGRVDVVFKVDEGDKTGVREIKFVGNQAVSNYRLHSLMQTTEMNWLSWFKTSDVYDPDRIAQDEEAIRKYYMKYGYADFRIANTDVAYHGAPDPGYVITITVDEGAQYHVSGVTVTSHLAKIDSASLQPLVKLRAGDVYNATAVDATVTAITRELARQGYAFSDVRPHGQRDEATHQIAVAFTVDDGPKVYIERIDVVGNTRTRDYVIRREFDIGEGDPYNHSMVEQGERRLNRLGYFKKVHISTRPGSTPDRVIVTVEVDDQPTGSVSLSGGYSTTAGFLAEVAFTETNFLGRGQYVKLSASEGQYSRGWGASFTEPYFLDQRLAAGFDVYHKEQNPNTWATYSNWTTGATVRLGVPITDEFTVQPSYSIYQSQIKIPVAVRGLQRQSCRPPTSTNSPPTTALTTGRLVTSSTDNCLTNGEASVAFKAAAAQGAVLTSALGYSLVWDSIDDRKNPTERHLRQLPSGRRRPRRPVALPARDLRRQVLLSDHRRPHRPRPSAGRPDQPDRRRLSAADRQFQPGADAGARLRAGRHGPARHQRFDEPRRQRPWRHDLFRRIGGDPVPDLRPAEGSGLEGRDLRRRRHAEFGFQGADGLLARCSVIRTARPCPGSNLTYWQYSCLKVDDDRTIRSSVGASLIWASPLGPIRIDYAYAVTKGKYDQLQAFNFTGGASF